MHFKTIAFPLGLFALHASARPQCKVELGGKSLIYYNHWDLLFPERYVTPGESGEIKTAYYTLAFHTSEDCNKVTYEFVKGGIADIEWKLTSTLVEA
ncbi:uncharacterized protein PgNI_00173 [Pyricularia grisea]|uniref:Uncharacterized protein n=1 Tax=Pyricularia grisea TaxID=148305 RepID=A0A6P8BHQ7_PYRGI|nr:uncharacterized protein PgNI_00173 [Pyricularia grisea]TLD16303.1 hypothetical protein PgNI_00173 [Pyricularia grisea]